MKIGRKHNKYRDKFIAYHKPFDRTPPTYLAHIRILHVYDIKWKIINEQGHKNGNKNGKNGMLLKEITHYSIDAIICDKSQFSFALFVLFFFLI